MKPFYLIYIFEVINTFTNWKSNAIIYICTFIFALGFLSSTAQNNNSHNQKLPWVRGEFPPVYGNYEYYVSTGSGVSLKDARETSFNSMLIEFGNKAGVKVNSQTLGEIKTSLTSSDVNKSYDESISFLHNYKIERENFKASFIKVNEYYEIVELGNRREYNLWELYQVSFDGSEFNPNIPQYTEFYGLSALWRSAILPGWGQFYKKTTLKGVAFLTSEAILISGLIYSEMRRSDNFRKSMETTNIQLIKQFRKRSDEWEIYRNIFIGGTIGVYTLNLLDAALVKGQVKYAFLSERLNFIAYNDCDTFNFGLTVNF